MIPDEPIAREAHHHLADLEERFRGLCDVVQAQTRYLRALEAKHDRIVQDLATLDLTCRQLVDLHPEITEGYH